MSQAPRPPFIFKMKKRQFLLILVIAVQLFCLGLSVYADTAPDRLGGYPIEYGQVLYDTSGTADAGSDGHLNVYKYTNTIIPAGGAVARVTVGTNEQGNLFRLRANFGIYRSDASDANGYVNSYTAVLNATEGNENGDLEYVYVIPRYWDEGYINITLDAYGVANANYRYTVTICALDVDISNVLTVERAISYANGYNEGLAKGRVENEGLSTFFEDFFTGLTGFFAPLQSVEVFGITPLDVLSVLLVAGLVALILRLRN